MNISDDVKFDDWRDYIENKLGTEPWIIVYSKVKNDDEDLFIFSALIPNNRIKDSLSKLSWNLIPGHGMPQVGHILVPNDHLYYSRYGNLDGIEPLIFYREFSQIKNDYQEISEEFRHYFNLYHDLNENSFIKIHSDGREEQVIKIDENGTIKIKNRYLKKYLAIKQMHLGIFFSIRRFSSKVFKLSNNEKYYREYKNKNYYYSLVIYDECYKSHKKSWAVLMGKKLIPGLTNYVPKYYNKDKKEKYVDFIVDVDENGENINHTCDPHDLGNYSIKPHFLTPIFFTKDVLGKYYNYPDKYSIHDNLITCGSLWSMYLDNNHPNYIIVFLGDLGQSLSYKEQHYWQSFNVAPEGNISKVAFKRQLMAEFAEPQMEDLVFKQLYNLINSVWYSKYGWKLFRDLKKKDEYLFKTLRVPLINDQYEFDQQLLTLTKLVIDYLNEGKIGKLIQNKKQEKGISKLEQFFRESKLTKFEVHIIFLRNLQELRSSGMAHPKGKNYEKTIKKFQIENDNLINTFQTILKKATSFLKYIGRELLT